MTIDAKASGEYKLGKLKKKVKYIDENRIN